MRGLQGDYFLLPKTTQWAGWLLLGLTAYLIFDQIHWWNLKEDYNFGYLVPFFCGYVVYDRWPRIKQLLGIGTTATEQTASISLWARRLGTCLTIGCFLAVICGSLLFVFAAFYRAAEGPSTIASLLAAGSFAMIALSVVYLFADVTIQGEPLQPFTRLRLTALFLFPAFIWLLSAPTFSVLEKSITTFLLNKVIFVVFGIYDLLGLDILRRGSVLVLPKGEVGVEDACSGIRSLTGSLFAGVFMASVYFEQWWKKILLVVCAGLLAIVGNICRSLFLTTWAYRYGADSITGIVHDITGYAVMGITIVGLLCLFPLLNLKLEYDDPNISVADKKQESP